MSQANISVGWDKVCSGNGKRCPMTAACRDVKGEGGRLARLGDTKGGCGFQAKECYHQVHGWEESRPQCTGLGEKGQNQGRKARYRARREDCGQNGQEEQRLQKQSVGIRDSFISSALKGLVHHAKWVCLCKSADVYKHKRPLETGDILRRWLMLFLEDKNLTVC